MGQPIDAPRRLTAGILLYVLEQAERHGHCALPRSALLEEAARLLETEADGLEMPLSQLILEGRVVVESNGDEVLVFSTDLHGAEEAVAGRIARLLQTPSSLPPLDPEAAIAWFERHHSLKLSDEQSDAVLRAAKERFFVLTGGPGSAKRRSCAPSSRFSPRRR
jgi:exodeoxyribonuclease V alpha subunit